MGSGKSTLLNILGGLILLCDAPTGALDYATGKLVLSAIELVNRELGTMTAVITRNAPIASLGDRVVTMGDGRIVRDELNHSKAPVASLQW
jgi:putative ABC transport system ATP-binding protein